MSTQYPSLYQLKCPFCGNEKYMPLGKKRSGLNQIVSGASMGAAPVIATAVLNQQAKRLTGAAPLQYQCTQCKKKYEFTPLVADTDEIIEKMCTINFERVKRFRGSAGTYTVYLNGVPIENLKNGESFTFQTNIKHNTVFVGFGDGFVYREYLNFEASPDVTFNIKFDGKFRIV